MHWQGFPCLTVGRFGFGREVWTTDMPGLMSNSLIGRGGECIRLGGKVAEVFHDVLLWGDGWRLGTKGEKAREKERVLYFGGKMHSSRKRKVFVQDIRLSGLHPHQTVAGILVGLCMGWRYDSLAPLQSPLWQRRLTRRAAELSSLQTLTELFSRSKMQRRPNRSHCHCCSQVGYRPPRLGALWP